MFDIGACDKSDTAMGIHMISAVLGIVFNYKNQSIFAIFAVSNFFQDQNPTA